MRQCNPVISIVALLLTYCLLAANSQAQSTDSTSSARSDTTSLANAGLDFEVYRTQIEPIFLKVRQDDITCYSCHSVLQTRMRLQRLEAGKTNWTEEQSRKNFDVVSKLVTPGAPTQSHFLLHPLAPEAGGEPQHTGGKFWKTQDDPEWKMIAAWIEKTSPSGATASGNKTGLDFEFFKQNVQPVFLQIRTGHAPCIACHTETNNNFRLQPLASGKTDWTEDQSKLNFDSTAQHVVPGDVQNSRLLLHPLAPEAGGDPFHSGGRQFFSKSDPGWVAFANWVEGAKADPTPPRSDSWKFSNVLMYMVDNASNTVERIDPMSNAVVQVISGVEVPHGINISRDGSRLFVSSEAEQSLVVFDRKKACVISRIPLSGRPNNITVTKDRSQILVGIRTAPGAVDVVSTETLKVIKTIPMKGSVHNIFTTPDGKYAVAGSIEGKIATVIDLKSLEPVWEVTFDHGVRPMTFETAPDGSTSRIFIQLSGYHGFAVVDFQKRAEVARIKLPDTPGGYGALAGRTAVPSHGIGTQPDGKKLWVASTEANAVFVYSLPDLILIGHASLPEIRRPDQSVLGSVPEWIAFTPDSKRVYVTDSALMSVSAFDTESMKEIARIPVGQVPKRIYTLVFDEPGK